MSRIPESLINEVRAKADIVDTISRYLTLTRKGKNYWGVCPFHDDHDPSMSVSTDRQIYKCFVCGAGGNVFSFVQNIENVSFVDAIVKTAESVNIDLSSYQEQSQRPVDKGRQEILKSLQEAQQFMAYQLFTKDGSEALSKLEARGYSEDLIRSFGIGVALGNNQIYSFLKAKGFEDKTLLAADLIRYRDDGSVADVFYNRIVFPIANAYGEVIGFSARALDKNSNVKYINTGETDVYVKGNTVYNYHNAKDASKKAGSVIITEGVTDAIAFTKAGKPNVVSLLGVAGTQEQIRLIKQCSPEVILAFDGDRAGQEATYAIGQKLVNARCNVYVWYNNSGLDPDDAVRKNGVESVVSGLEQRLNWLDFVLSYALNKYGLDNFDKRKRVVEFVIEHLKTADELTQNYYLKLLEQKTGFDMNALTSKVASAVTVDQKPKVFVPRTVNKTIRDVSIPERTILKQMIGSKEAAYRFRDRLGYLVSNVANDYALIILDCYRNQESIEIADVLSRNLHDDVRNLVLEIESSDIVGTYSQVALDENINLVQRELARLGMDSLTQEGRQSVDFEKQLEIFKKAIEHQRNRNK